MSVVGEGHDQLKTNHDSQLKTNPLIRPKGHLLPHGEGKIPS
jgi:hypothetical protein